jgi:ADP-ribosylglycohydrolase/ADP-ribose pyrophosphatase YjhB (NUDIX family)
MTAPEIRERPGVRVIVIDESGQVLLLNDWPLGADPVDAKWVVPGGGLEEDESTVVGAARELREETGLSLTPEELGDVIATSTGRWMGGAEPTKMVQASESYYAAHVRRFDVDTSGMTALEREMVREHRWWSLDDIRQSTERIYPPGLADLVEMLLHGDRPSEPLTLPWETTAERVRGCLIGGAVGDALGNPIEFLSLMEIREKYGRTGLAEMVSPLITDDTQMTLFSAEGLLNSDLDGNPRVRVHAAYLRWLDTQMLLAPPSNASGLAAEDWLYARRSPGNACLSGLQHSGSGQVNPHSKGCGTVMRSAPFGLVGYGADRAYEFAAACATLTHGHPTAASAAGAFAAIVDELIAGAEVADAVDVALTMLRGRNGGEETAAALQAAVDLSGRSVPSPQWVELLGGGWVAEEALAIAVYCALAADHFPAALLLAVNHSGDSDSTGSICGNLLGAAHGIQELPRPWVNDVEGRSTLNRVAAEIVAARSSAVRPDN